LADLLARIFHKIAPLLSYKISASDVDIDSCTLHIITHHCSGTHIPLHFALKKKCSILPGGEVTRSLFYFSPELYPLFNA
jgi:hypothetical protein